MTNKKLFEYSPDELKEKLIRFYFSIGGFFGGYGSIDIVKNDNEIKYRYEHDQNIINEEYNLSLEKWQEFINKIFDLKIYKWREKYDDNNILDGTQWKIEMEFYGIEKSKFFSYGSNEYPYKWNEFVTIISTYFPQMGDRRW